MTAASARIPQPAARGTFEDLRRRAAARLADRIDFSKTKHKPVSLVRAEAKKVVELFLDLEAPGLPPTDRERVVLDVLGEAIGFGPLEELFRDESVPEFMAMGPNLVIARKATGWVPTSVRFQDAEHYNRILMKVLIQGERTTAGPHATGGFDVKLPNGFRVTAVMPPAVLETPPVAVFLRVPPEKSGPVAVPTNRSGVVAAPASRSAAVAAPLPRPTLPVTPPARSGPPKESSGTISFNATLAPSAGGSNTELLSGSFVGDSVRFTDPVEKIRQRSLQRLIERLSAIGVYDVSALPPHELHKVIAVQVAETAAAEKLPLDDDARDRLALEILEGMQR